LLQGVAGGAQQYAGMQQRGQEEERQRFEAETGRMRALEDTRTNEIRLNDQKRAIFDDVLKQFTPMGNGTFRNILAGAPGQPDTVTAAQAQRIASQRAYGTPTPPNSDTSGVPQTALAPPPSGIQTAPALPRPENPQTIGGRPIPSLHPDYDPAVLRQRAETINVNEPARKDLIDRALRIERGEDESRLANGHPFTAWVDEKLNRQRSIAEDAQARATRNQLTESYASERDRDALEIDAYQNTQTSDPSSILNRIQFGLRNFASSLPEGPTKSAAMALLDRARSEGTADSYVAAASAINGAMGRNNMFAGQGQVSNYERELLAMSRANPGNLPAVNYRIMQSDEAYRRQNLSYYEARQSQKQPNETEAEFRTRWLNEKDENGAPRNSINRTMAEVASERPGFAGMTLDQRRQAKTADAFIPESILINGIEVPLRDPTTHNTLSNVIRVPEANGMGVSGFVVNGNAYKRGLNNTYELVVSNQSRGQ
jgi:hypothetical protein